MREVEAWGAVSPRVIDMRFSAIPVRWELRVVLLVEFEESITSYKSV